jgi:glycosyltransferase involved in cell wall biosynthesis
MSGMNRSHPRNAKGLLSPTGRGSRPDGSDPDRELGRKSHGTVSNGENADAMKDDPCISVVVCTLNGAARLPACLGAARAQEVRGRVQLVVVDDGSSDCSADVASAHGAEVIRHETNRGLAAARNTGVAAATADVVAFLDDDCEPERSWAAALLEAFSPNVVGVGGQIVATAPPGFLAGYLSRNNPLVPLELDLAASSAAIDRFGRYLVRSWSFAPTARREIFSAVGANMAFRKSAIEAVDGFDERFSFGGEEQDLCFRLHDAFGEGALMFEPSAVVRHHFGGDTRSVLRRQHAYGIGAARLYCKRADVPPTIFPYPFLVATILAFALSHRTWLPVVALVPQLLFPRGARQALRQRSISPLLDCYLRLAEESFSNVGFAAGAWRFRATF